MRHICGIICTVLKAGNGRGGTVSELLIYNWLKLIAYPFC
jgi:hypothetical protein